MLDDREVLEQVLEGTLRMVDADPVSMQTSCRRRLLEALRGKAGPHELAALVRHLLRFESERQGSPQKLRLARGRPWSHPGALAAHDIHREPHSAGYDVVRAAPWFPEWLACGTSSPEADASGQAVRRSLESPPGDPFLRILDRESYLCDGQKHAVRAVLTAPAGSTLVVNLPTGHGKSLCGQLPGVLRSPYGAEGGVVVVVVPTVALCLDQAKAVQAQIDGKESAYHSGASEAVRAQIRQRIRDGGQPIVYTSPEALVTSLKRPVFAAAAAGRLRALVIDEAHMVSQWGDAFRPQFQELAGMRQALLDECPGDQAFRTMLLSATLTGTSLETLETLFGRPGPFRVISAVQLRPEPAYWACHCADEEMRRARVLEAVRHLPRPLILYTTEVEHANQWGQWLREDGYRHRVAVMTGDTGSAERDRIICGWRDRELDIVAATAAFGLGIDQQDVRAVIHACIPETLDRFYQEVGRGGRDGNASISLVLHTEGDRYVAKGLNQKALITCELGRHRWNGMFQAAATESLGGGRYRIPVDVGRTLDMQNRQNVAWNIRTLTLMSRADLIALEGEPPSAHSDGEQGTPERETRVVRLRVNDHTEEECWKERIEPFRARSAQAQWRLYELMREFLHVKRCAADILAEAYEIREGEGLEQRITVPVTRGCGGCEYCRRERRAPYTGAPVSPRFPWAEQTAVGTRLAQWLGQHRLLVLCYPSGQKPNERVRQWQLVVDWAIHQGVRLVVGPRALFAEPSAQLETTLRHIPVFVEQRYESRGLPRVPTLVIHDPEDPPAPAKRWLDAHRGSEWLWAPHVLLLPDDTPCPERPGRLLREMLYPTAGLEEWKLREGIR